MNKQARCNLDEIMNAHQQGFLTDAEVLTKVLKVFPDHDGVDEFWSEVPDWMKDQIKTYFLHQGHEKQFVTLKDQRDLSKERVIFQWLKNKDMI